MEIAALISVGLSVAQAGISMVGNAKAARQAKKDAARQKQYYDQKAQSELAKGTHAARNESDRARSAISRNTAVAGASGTAANYGDPLRLSGEVAETGAANVKATLYNTDLAITAANYGGEEAIRAGNRSYDSHMLKAYGAGLSGASSLFKMGDWGVGGGSGGSGGVDANGNKLGYG